MSGITLPDSRSRQKQIVDVLGSTAMMFLLLCLWVVWFYGATVCFLTLFGEEAIGIPVVDLVAACYFMVTMVSCGLLALLRYSPSLNEWCCESKMMSVPLFVLFVVVFTSFLAIFIFAWEFASESEDSRRW